MQAGHGSYWCQFNFDPVLPALISIPFCPPSPKTTFPWAMGVGPVGSKSQRRSPDKVSRRGSEEEFGISAPARVTIRLIISSSFRSVSNCHAGVRPTQSCGTRGHTCQCPCSLPRRRLPWRLRPLLQRAPSAPTAAKLTVAVAVSAPAAAQPSPKAQSSASAAAWPATEGRSAPAAATPWTRPPVVPAETPTSRSLV